MATTDTTETASILDPALADFDLDLIDDDVYQVVVIGSNDFKADSAVSTTKFDLPLLLTPQSITVITEAVMESQQASTLSDVLKNDASISQTASFQGIRERFSARGFELSAQGNYLRNGRVYWFYDFPPAEILERVEIIKGPSAIYGQGSPGATINMITKAPTFEKLVDIEAGAASFDDYRLLIDIGGPIGEDVAYRANFVGKRAKSFRDRIFNNREVGAFTIDWFANDATLLNFYIDMTYDERPQDSGLIAIGDQIAAVPRSTVLNAPWAINDTRTFNIGSSLDYEINHFWRLEAGVNMQDLHRDRINSTVRRNADDNSGDFQLEYQRRKDNWRYYTSNIDFISDQPLFNKDNQFLIGINYIRRTLSQQATDRLLFDETFNVFDPIVFPDNPNLPLERLPGSNINDFFGVYIQDAFSITERWDLMGGLRYDFAHFNPRTNTSFSEHHVTPRIGLLYKVTPTVSSYISYLESFEPNGVVDGDYINDGQRLKPTVGRQVEWGVKADLLENRLGLSSALFYIVRDNQVTPSIDNSGNRVLEQRGQQTHQGLELSAVGRPVEHWRILASMMYLDAKITGDTNPIFIGNTPHGAPTWSASLWNEYDLSRIPNLSLYGGLFYESSRQGDDENTFTAPGYTRIDVGVSHRIQFSDAELITRFNVENLFDTTYFYATDRNEITVGEPRMVRLSVNVLFS